MLGGLRRASFIRKGYLVDHQETAGMVASDLCLKTGR